MKTLTSRRLLKGLISGGFALAAMAAFAGFYGELAAGDRAGAGETGASASHGLIRAVAPVAAAERAAEAALNAEPPDFAAARRYSLKTLSQDPANVSALNRLVYIDLAEDNRLSRDGLAALYESYTVSPYGEVTVMTWRVDLASRVWRSLPDDLRAATLAQLPVIASVHTTWDWRVETCRTNPVPAIHEPVCAATPGIERPRAAEPSQG